jgi:integrase
LNKVEPIKDADKLRWIQEDLGSRTDWHSERMFLLFELGIHTGLRISDLVRLRVEHVNGDGIRTVEKKTGKETYIPLNATIRTIIQDRTRGMDGRALLFPSRCGDGDSNPKPITTRTAYNDMQIIARRYGLRGNIGCHTLRKTFGYWHYKQNGNLALLRGWFNHTDDSVTMRYIGMDDEEKRKSVEGFNPGGAVYTPRGSINRGRPRETGKPIEVEHLDREKQGELMGKRAKERREKEKKNVL